VTKIHFEGGRSDRRGDPIYGDQSTADPRSRQADERLAQGRDVTWNGRSEGDDDAVFGRLQPCCRSPYCAHSRQFSCHALPPVEHGAHWVPIEAGEQENYKGTGRTELTRRLLGGSTVGVAALALIQSLTWQSCPWSLAALARRVRQPVPRGGCCGPEGLIVSSSAARSQGLHSLSLMQPTLITTFCTGTFMEAR